MKLYYHVRYLEKRETEKPIDVYFAQMIAEEQEKGYALDSWQYQKTPLGGVRVHETILALFKKE